MAANRSRDRSAGATSAPVASELMGQGGVWNSFILAANGKTLLEFFDEKLPGVSATLQDALARDLGVAQTMDVLSRAYDGLGSFDFCRDVLEGQEHRLSVLPVPRCGWSDLGTPDRVARCVARMPSSPAPTGRPDAGDIVRWENEASPYGQIVRYESDHRFHTGEPSAAYEIRLADTGETVWLSHRVVVKGMTEMDPQEAKAAGFSGI